MEPVSNRKGENNNLGFSEVEDQGAGEMVAQQGEDGPTTKKPRVEDEEEMVAQQGEEGPTTKKPRDQDEGDGEMVAQQGEEGPTTKKPCDEDEDEDEPLTILNRFRNNWLETMSRFVGPLDATTGTEIGPKHYTESGPPRYGGIDYDAYEIFSIKVTEIKEGLEWPLHVFGFVSVRDSMDCKRNMLFHRYKENCQVLTAEDPYLELTGPSRAIALIDPPEFEVELRVMGSNPSVEKILSAAFFRYNNNSCNGSLAGLVRTHIVSTKRSTIEVKYSHLKVPLEATIEIHHLEGSSDFHGIFFAHMFYMGEDKIVLLNSSDCNVTIESDSSIPLSRCVVLVDEDAELTLGVKAWQGENEQDGVVRHAEFPAKFHSKSDAEFNVGFCKMSVSVFWSVLC